MSESPDTGETSVIPADWADAQPLLRPVLRPQSYVNSLTSGGAQPWSRTIWPLVNEMVVVDLPDARATVTLRETDRWGISAEQAFAAARANLAARRATLTPGESVMLNDADGSTYVDSMILVDGFLTSPSAPDAPRPLVFFPGDGMLLVCTDSPDTAPQFFDAAENMYLEADRPISPQGYTVAGGTIVACDQAGPHPLRGLALRARALLTSQEYEAQTELLRAKYESELLPQYVGSAQVIQTPWGPRTTAVWGEGIPWELPQTDYLTFAAGDPSAVSDSFTVPFSTVLDLVGIAPIAGLTPARYRADAWPAPELVMALKAHAIDLPG